VIRAFHGWPKPKALAALAMIVSPAPQQIVDKAVEELRSSVRSKLKIQSERDILAILSKVVEGCSSRQGNLFCFSVNGKDFELKHYPEHSFLWNRSEYGLTLVFRFSRKDFERNDIHAT